MVIIQQWDSRHVDKKSHKNSTNNNRYFSSFHKNNPKKKRPISLQVNCETNPEKHSLLNFISIMNMSVWWHTTQKKVYHTEECTLHTEKGSIMNKNHILIFRKPDKDHRWTIWTLLDARKLIINSVHGLGEKIIWKHTEIIFAFAVTWQDVTQKSAQE